MKAKYNAYDMNREPLYMNVPLHTPYGINIEPTSYCNLKCNYCVHALTSDELKKRDFSLGYMELNLFKEIIEQTKQFPGKIKKITFSGLGEPVLHQQLPEMVQLIKNSNIASEILLNTNAILLNKEIIDVLIAAGLSEIKISLQGVTNDKYKQYCNTQVDYNKLYENIVYLSEHKKSCVLKVKIPETALNDEEKKTFISNYENLCDYIGFETLHDQFPGVNYSDKIKANKSTSRFGREYKELNVCPVPFYRCSIRWDGRVTLCMPDNMRDTDQYISNSTLFDIWNGITRNELLKSHLVGKRRNNKRCSYCFNPEYVSLPDDILDGHEEDILKRIEV